MTAANMIVCCHRYRRPIRQRIDLHTSTYLLICLSYMISICMTATSSAEVAPLAHRLQRRRQRRDVAPPVVQSNLLSFRNANSDAEIYGPTMTTLPTPLTLASINAHASSYGSSDDGSAASNELDAIEMHTNNHHASTSSQGLSRHYNAYSGHAYHAKPAYALASSPSGLSGSGGPSASGYTSSGAHNHINLNYIHNILLASKSPPSSASVSSQQQHHSPQQNSYSTQHSLAYYSAHPFQPLSSMMMNQQQQQQQHHNNYNHINNNIDSVISQYSADSIASNSIGASPLEDAQLQQQEQQQRIQHTVELGNACGRQQVAGSREPRIVGGNNTYEGEFPWAVSIQRHGNHHCGGVIVGRRWILTAAHCVRSQLVANLLVRTGGHTLSRAQANHVTSHLQRDYNVEQIIMHDDFSRYDNLSASQLKSSANTNNADIALLKLKADIHWNELAWPVCFPQRDAGNFSGHDAIVVGWGKLNEKSDDFSNELQKVKLTIIDNRLCQNWFRQAGREMPIDERIICAGFKNGGKDACHGDSGGPLLSKINGHYVVVGVVSTGIGCARPLLPGLYSRVSSYISWIERHIALVN